MMDMNLLTSADIPILLEALFSQQHEVVLGRLHNASELAARRIALRASPFYAPFCKP